jgi:hypothetical protein
VSKSSVRHFYGSDPSQFADLRLPLGATPARHGGVPPRRLVGGPLCGADNLDRAAADLAERGRVAWNVEYRRLTLGGGYPSTLEDVATAIDHLATHGDVPLSQVVAIGTQRRRAPGSLGRRPQQAARRGTWRRDHGRDSPRDQSR